VVEVWCDLSLTTNSQQLIIAFWRRSCKQARVGCVLLLCLLTFHCRSVVGVASNMIWPVCCLGQGRELPADHTLYAGVPAPHTRVCNYVHCGGALSMVWSVAAADCVMKVDNHELQRSMTIEHSMHCTHCGPWWITAIVTVLHQYQTGSQFSSDRIWSDLKKSARVQNQYQNQCIL